MKFPSFGSIGKNLTLLVMLAVLPALVILLYSGMEQRRQSIENAKRDVLLLTHSMVATQEDITSATRQTLSTLALVPAIQNLDVQESSGILRAVLERNPDYLNITLSDVNGEVLASGTPFTGANLADRKHVREALARKDFAVGEYVLSRVVEQTVPVFAFAHPVLDRAGRPWGVLTAALRLDRFAAFYDVSRLPAGSFVAVTDHQGVRLFFHPAREETHPIGKPINAKVWDTARKAAESGIAVFPGSDGVRRITAFEHVRLTAGETPYMVMWAGIPEEHILGAADAVLVRNLSLLFLATLMALGISWAIGRNTLISPIKSLVGATRGFARGNLEARSGLSGKPDELGTLARAFDDMAEALSMGQQALRDREAFIRAVLDNLPIGVAVNSFEPPVRFEYMNDNFPRFYRTTRQALADPDAFWEAVYEDPQFREEMKGRVLADCASGDPARMYWPDVPLVRKEGGTTFVSARNTPIIDKNIMISTVWDVTDLKLAAEERQRLQDQLAQAQKMESVGRLAGGVAHDFNNMLSVILGYTELALAHVGSAKPLRADLQEVKRAAQRSAELIRQLLAFARKQTVAPEVLNLNDALEDMLKMLRRLIGEDIDLAWLPASDLWLVRMDPSQLDQIMVNLCVNARDAIAGVGRITMATENITLDRHSCRGQEECAPGDYVMLTISDTGCGMDKETLANIFDPFFTTKDLGKGTGLGLATVFGIVKQNLGFIRVSSEAGKGAMFTIYLPRLSGQAVVAGKDEEPAEVSRSRGETILLVEDDPTVMATCRSMLESLGYRVLVAGKPGEAVRLAAKHAGEIDLLLTDVVMPEMNGRELATTLLSAHPALKCLFMSGYTADIIDSQGVLPEGVHLMQKPFSLQDLALHLRKVLEHK